MSTTAIANRHRLRIRQSTLRHLEDHCPAMAYALSVEQREGPAYSGAYRGQAVHDFFARYVQHLYDGGRQTDWDAVGEILTNVFQCYPALRFEQRQDVADQARRIAESFIFRPECFYGVEEPFETNVPLDGGEICTVTGRLDYLEVEDGVARIWDVKSNHQMIPDSRVWDDTQLKVYAMLVLDNLPHVDLAEGRLLMSRYGISLPQRGEAVWTRENVRALRSHLSSRLAAHFAGRLRGERVPGTWCQYCPLRRPGRCTLYRSYHGTVPPPPLSEQQARKLARQVMALEDARELRLSLLKDYVNEHGPLAVGSGEYAEVFAFHQSESEEIAATAVMEILQNYRREIGDQPVDELLSVDKRSRAFRALKAHTEIRRELEAATTTKKTTRFGHKAV